MKLLLGIALLSGLVLSVGCAHTTTASSRTEKTLPAKEAPRRVLLLEPIKLQAVAGTEGPQVEVLDAGSLFERGGQLLSSKKYKKAIEQYDKLLLHFPDSRYVSPTLYNAGLCHEWQGEFDAAAKRYRELMERFGSTKEAVDAGFRLGGCYAELKNWPASAQVFNELLQRKDLSTSDRIEVMARKGLAHFRLGDMQSCKSTLTAAVRFHKSIETVERLDTDFFLAMVHYYLAAIPHVDFRQLKVDPGAKMAQTLDEKARLLLVSQASYIKAIKVKNPFWATAAGFQIGSLYREFYRVLLTTLPDFTKQARRNAKLAKIPVSKAKQELIQVYMEEVHKAVKSLLHKAISVFEKNVMMAERVGIQSNWVGKSRRQIQELQHLLSLPPKDVVELVKKDKLTPEDKPPLKEDRTQDPAKDPDQDPGGPDRAPARPSDSLPQQEIEEPGRVVL